MKKPLCQFITILLSLLVIIPSQAVIILDSTYHKSGFKPAENLAHAPQFASLIFINGDSMWGSGAWIGNYEGHGYVLTAGHMFPKDTKVSDYGYQTLDGTQYHGDSVSLHPLWNGNAEDRTGYDFAIVRLKEEIKNAGQQPALYEGSSEYGKTLTFIGYGWRGTGSKGQDTSLDTGDRPAAAVGLVEAIEKAHSPVPKTGDAGNYLAIWLPKEDGSIPNPIRDNGIIKPVSPLAGILGSGDSGGPAWIQTDNGWAIAGVNSDGDGNAAYGNESWFPRVSQVKDWIKQQMPAAIFIQ